MTDLGLTLPLKIKRMEESFGITDAAGRSICFVYFADHPDRQSATRRVGPEQAQRIAQAVARALTAEIKGSEGP